MFSKRSMVVVVLLALFTLLVSSSVLADDGRINRAPYHFGGDTLFCSQEKGCTLLDKDGHDLANWPTNAIATALSNADKSGQKLEVGGNEDGTYGPMQLWAMPGKTADGNSTLCMVGFDEWGKQNDMCFEVTKDWHFQQAPLPVSGEVDHSCDRWSVGDGVFLISDPSKFGKITSINKGAGTLTFGGGISLAPSSYTAKCTEVAPQVT